MSNAIVIIEDSGAQPARWPAGRRNFAGFYIEEMLGHAGLFFDVLEKAELPSKVNRHRLAILPWQMALSSDQRHALTQFVSSGGCLLGIGGTSGLNDVFGCTAGEELTSGHIRRCASAHAATATLEVPTRVFGGRRLIRKNGNPLAVVVIQGDESGSFDALIENRFGRGSAMAIGPDIVWSVLHMQQGSAVVPGEVDGIVDVEKGAALDSCEDRQRFDGDQLSILEKRTWDDSPDDPRLACFEPMADNLRELLIRAVLWMCREQDIVLPMLWYWPGGLDAVAHMSHDTESNVQAQADRLFAVVNQLQLQTTWCVRYPGGYEKRFYPRLLEQGCEIALHFDSQTRKEHTTWSLDDLRFQYEWLCREAGIERIVANKNHYLRWEGRLEFYRWCRDVGIELDETKGPNYAAMNGFPFGGCHPWFPADDAQPGAPVLDVLEVNLMTQDLVFRCPPPFARIFVDKVLERYGVAHFLFHPTNIHLPGVEPALREIVAYSQSKGIEWWPAERINAWERARRGVQCRAGDGVFAFPTDSDLDNASLLFLNVAGKGMDMKLGVSHGASQTKSIKRYGFSFASTTAGLKASGPDLVVTLGSG